MKLDYSGILQKNLKNYVDFKEIDKTQRRKIINNLFTKKSSDMLDWLDLPEQTDEEIDYLMKFGKQIRKKYKNFVVLGIGGSALGTKMLKNAFLDSVNKYIGINVYICDNIDTYFTTLIEKIDLKKTMFNVITKSGSTSETLAQMAYILNKLKSKKISPSKHFCVTTTKGNALYDYAIQNEIQTFDIPVGVGGRFSVLSNVGLVPASVMGLSLKDLLKGARNAKENAKLLNLDNIAYTLAFTNYSYLKKGLTNLVVMPYSDRLSYFADFFCQLWAESLGKKFDKDGKLVFCGQNPIKALGVTDQHSQLQLYEEGLKDKVIMFVRAEENICREKINVEFPFAKHINNISFNELLNIEQDATAYSLTCVNRPNYTISLEKINEESIGELIFLSEMMTAFMGELLNIDTYNQPGVELGKIYTKACLNCEKYKKEREDISSFISNKKFLLLNK